MPLLKTFEQTFGLVNIFPRACVTAVVLQDGAPLADGGFQLLITKITNPLIVVVLDQLGFDVCEQGQRLLVFRLSLIHI